jgi:hypothetical protein
MPNAQLALAASVGQADTACAALKFPVRRTIAAILIYLAAKGVYPALRHPPARNGFCQGTRAVAARLTGIASPISPALPDDLILI